ncbi:MAG: hypothetical protein L6428_05010 [Candidatus Aminicenantes bacterium]|nr:hypothetical protein [Acidobacteriota bacterium]MCG2810800.1 hypothetical protein [Candidatus Aminicenantes bacterium]
MKALFRIMVVFVFLLISRHSLAQQQPLTFESLYGFASPRDLTLSPEGRQKLPASLRIKNSANSDKGSYELALLLKKIRKEF